MVDEKSPFFSQLFTKHPPPADSGIRLVRPNGYDQLEGKEREALQYFEDVLAIKPSHIEAASEARILRQRLKK